MGSSTDEIWAMNQIINQTEKLNASKDKEAV